MELLSQTWHWSISGFIIGIIMLLLTYFGKTFGMSSNLRSLCSMTGIGKKVSFFDWDWKSQRWNFVVVLGAMIGGFVAVHYMQSSDNVSISEQTITELSALGIDSPNGKLLPDYLFGMNVFSSFKMILILLSGGFLIGFGSRYAGGCTSGHAISGLSNLQIPSLKAVIGFFVGGLIMSYFLLPLILN
ncbi:YeeE/YedE family protein [Flavobacterium capsici]|uniref:YeeE/YedE thiosulfate transporter family protein n=1 Tax=Flavobacterium capsici TaxID=3075618 RepID=A0AA96JBF6_9FLAO|nr:MULTISPECIES: YeeE/YedE thiosulfate transporter family protein [unclassified Flavobacterium]WNM18538.1 YeeE/YedE thiosulfate transporter family protein [Flavobacterium sp. PMR2A8]WNM22589.1 YeeE/YedE thiosulfate transporter family protein [Flavobacterium sp. PMTSA4]